MFHNEVWLWKELRFNGNCVLSKGWTFWTSDYVFFNALLPTVITFCYWINFLSEVMLSASSGLDFGNCMQQQSPAYEAQLSKKFPVTWWIQMLITLFTVAHIPFITWAWQSTVSHTTLLKTPLNTSIVSPPLPGCHKFSLPCRLSCPNFVWTSLPLMVLHAVPISSFVIRSL